MCGGADTSSYLFFAGLNAAGEPFYAIGPLDIPEAGVQALRDSTPPTPRPPGSPSEAGVSRATPPTRCFSTSRSTARRWRRVSAPFGSSVGEVGLFAMGQGPESVTVDLNDFEATGTRD